MIDEKINNSLRELEQSLQKVEASRKQVERTVNSYDGLSKIMTGYVDSLGGITSKVQGLITSIGKDYNQKVKEFEKDRGIIVNACNTASEKLSNATDEFASSLKNIEKKLTYSLVTNGVSLIIIVVLVILMISSK